MGKGNFPSSVFPTSVLPGVPVYWTGDIAPFMYHAMTKQSSAQDSFDLNAAPLLTSPPAERQHRKAVDGTSAERTEFPGLNAITPIDHLGLVPIPDQPTHFTFTEIDFLPGRKQSRYGLK